MGVREGMTIITINEEKTDRSKSIWKMSVDLDAPTIIGLLAKCMACCDVDLKLESLKVKQ